MTHVVVTALLALSLSSTPHKAAPAKNPPPPPVEHPKPPPPPQGKPEPDRQAPSPPRPEDTGRGANYRQTGPQYREDPAVAIIRRNQPQIQSCYGMVGAQSSRMQGAVVLEWDVATDGRVEHAQIKENGTGSSELAGCMLQTVKGWEFRDGPTTYPGHMRHSFQIQVLQ